MKWSTDLPTRAGWYWYRDPKGAGNMPWIRDRAVVVEVATSGARGPNYPALEVWVTHMDYADPLSTRNFPGEWAGPIEPPK